MKILAIMGSPKGKGAGFRIVTKIEQRMKALGDVEFAYLFLKDANIQPCTGCYVCMAHGEDNCPLKDDRAAIVQNILAADGVILSSPVYVSTVSWLMKLFIDRFAYNNHRPQFHRQKLLTVVNAAGSYQKPALASLRWALGGARVVSELALQTPPWPQTQRAVARKERAIVAAASKFYQACLNTALPVPTLATYLNFLAMQELSLRCRQYLTADYAYYNGKAYHYATRINPLTAALARAIAGAMAGTLEEMNPGNVNWPVAQHEELPV